MKSISLQGFLLAILMLPSAGSAQGFLPFGQPVGGGVDALVTVPLPFSVPMPDGVAVTSLDICIHGFVAPGGTIVSPDPSESVAELLAGPPRICAYWDDLGPTDPIADEIWFDATSTPNTVVVTWVDVGEFLEFGSPTTFQLQIDTSGIYTIVWDDRAGDLGGDALVGLSPGGAAMDPGESDFSSLFPSSMLTVSSATVYEEFLVPPAGSFDLSDRSLVFLPDGFGGYFVAGTETIATTRQGRSACTDAPTFTFTPSGVGYLVTEGGVVDRAYRSGVALGLVDETLSAPLALPFSFALPGGTSVTEILVSDNGRLLQNAPLVAPDLSPDVVDLILDPWASICPLWADLDSGMGSVWFHDAGSSVSVTWEDVPQFGLGYESKNTFQVRLFPDGSIQFLYVDIRLVPNAGDIVVGLSPGSLTSDSEGESDFATVIGSSIVSADGLVYESFVVNGNAFDLADLPRPNDTVALRAITKPRIGLDLVVEIEDSAGTATTVLGLFGFPTGLIGPAIDLSPLGIGLSGCEILTDLFTPGALVAAPIGAPNTPIVVMPIPNDPMLLGIEGLVVSSLVIDPTRSPALFPTDEIVTRIGN
jgi:hypothetical protein